MKLSNVTVGVGVYCVAKATLYDYMTEGIGRKSPQLWVPVADVVM